MTSPLTSPLAANGLSIPNKELINWYSEMIYVMLVKYTSKTYFLYELIARIA